MTQHQENRSAVRSALSGTQEAVKHTPGPWEYVPSTEHHGPYVTSEFGSTICDCYVMSNPSAPSVRNGGDSKPIHFLHEMADPNVHLIAAAPDMLTALKLIEHSYPSNKHIAVVRAALAKAGAS